MLSKLTLRVEIFGFSCVFPWETWVTFFSAFSGDLLKIWILLEWGGGGGGIILTGVDGLGGGGGGGTTILAMSSKAGGGGKSSSVSSTSSYFSLATAK